MAFATVRGIRMHYEVIGERGSFVALITGGRRDYGEFIPLAHRLAAEGYRVVLHDRRNTGASDVLIEGEVAEEILWLDDLMELLKQLGAVPAFVGGSSAGARTAMRFYLRHPNAVRGLLLMRVTGGAVAAGKLPENYYGQFIKLAKQGGMAAVCAHEQYAERIAANPATKDRLMAMPVEKYVAVMQNWMDQFIAGASLPVMGVREDELRSMKIPAVLMPGNDLTHSSASGRLAASLIPGCRLHELPVTDRDVQLVPYPEWAPLEPEITREFVKLMREVEARGG